MLPQSPAFACIISSSEQKSRDRQSEAGDKKKQHFSLLIAPAAVCKYSSHQQSWCWRGPNRTAWGPVRGERGDLWILLAGSQTDGGFGEQAGSSLQGCRG